MSNVGLIEVAIEEEIYDFTPLQKRVFANKIRRMLDEIDPPKTEEKINYGDIPIMTEQEAHNFQRDIILYGKHAGQAYEEIPDDYLGWLCDAKLKEWKQLRRYLTWRNTQQ